MLFNPICKGRDNCRYGRTTAPNHTAHFVQSVPKCLIILYTLRSLTAYLLERNATTHVVFSPSFLNLTYSAYKSRYLQSSSLKPAEMSLLSISRLKFIISNSFISGKNCIFAPSYLFNHNKCVSPRRRIFSPGRAVKRIMC